ncbi:MAG: sterol desaturase family protein [Bacteroidia bacterium]|nr:sterol desaturase family protein [Bacteroidia bacterium]
MGGLQYAGYIIPVLLLLALLEYTISRRKNIEAYRFSDTIVNMSCGMLERLFDFFYVVMMYFVYAYLYENFAIAHIPFEGQPVWIQALILLLALLVADFLAYWHHRLSHEINFLWAGHIVHHQSEELNITTVFRVSAISVIYRSFFFVWMPLVGFPSAVVTFATVFIGLYQFVTHTRLVGKLGFLEYILVTPSSHRVHHARNEKYLDKNYGHVFIFWDRIMGTFEEEEEEPEYGITTGFESSNPYWAYFYYWVDLIKRSRRADNWKDKIRVFLMPPAWAPENDPFPAKEYERDENGKRKKYQLDMPFRLQLYVFINILLTIGGFVFLMIRRADLSPWTIAQIASIIGISVLSYGLLMERKKWALYFEIFRLAFIMVNIPVLFLGMGHVWLPTTIFALMLAFFSIWMLRMRDYFGIKLRVATN